MRVEGVPSQEERIQGRILHLQLDHDSLDQVKERVRRDCLLCSIQDSGLRRTRIQGSETCVSLNSRLRSNEYEKKLDVEFFLLCV